MMVMVAQIAQPGMAFATLPACVLSCYGVAVVLREEIRYARHDSIKARMKRFAMEERARRAAPSADDATQSAFGRDTEGWHPARQDRPR